MNIVLQRLVNRDDGAIELHVSCGGGPVRAFLVTYDEADPKYKYCSVDEELFMQLSERVHSQNVVMLPYP
jgi:hypothetical protein